MHLDGITVHHQAPYLTVAFPEPQRTLSWAIVGGGFAHAEQVVWREVRNADLPRDLDPVRWFHDQLRQRCPGRAVVGLLTSRDLCHHEIATAHQDGVSALCVATVGLANALRAGDPAPHDSYIGTINVLLWLSAPLSDEALAETLALASEAKALAIAEAGTRSFLGTGLASGTGTDCVVVAAPCAPEGSAPHRYAGKHTLLGHLAGKVVLSAVGDGAARYHAASVRG